MSASDLLTLIRADKGLQINLLAMFCALLIGFQVVLGSCRRRSGNKIIVSLLRVAYTISFPVFVYTIGLVQSVEATKRIDSQLLWAVGLLLLLGSVDGMSAFRRHEVEHSGGMLAQHIVKTVLVLWLLVSRSDVSEHRWILLLYFLLCWVYSILRFAQRMAALRKASSVHGLVRSAKVVADYMEDIYAASGSGSGSDDVIHDHDLRLSLRDMLMAKCKYLVLGEEKDSSPPSSKAPYLSKVGGKGKVVMFHEIWNSNDKLLSPEDDQTRALKDTCLSFAFFKLLKRRFCGLHIAEKGDPAALEFVLANGERAFHLVEVELSFLYDLFYTKYPALFPASPALCVVRFVVLLGLFKVLLFDFALEAITSTMLFDFDDKLATDLLQEATGYSSPAVVFIFFNNILVVVMILGIDILQDIVTRYSNWAIVHYVCDHVRRSKAGEDGECRKGWWMTARRWWRRGLFGIRPRLIKWVAARRASKPTHWWNNKLGQYSLLKLNSYGKQNAFSLLMEKIGEGRKKREKDAPLTAEIKTAVLSSLRESSGQLSVGRSRRSRELRAKTQQLHWAPFELPTSTHTVLVWHIATTICACADQDDTSDELPGRIVATRLSGYCAYLLAFVPDMLPDHSYKARQILDAVILDARERLGKTRTLPERCSDLSKLEAPIGKVQDMSILILGADLAKCLLLEDNLPQQWDQLASFWADLVLFLAPSDKPDVHADCLATGGEFMTHLWALLTHAGIVDRSNIHAASHA
uniref:Uncharacterized protein n=1 Tax=Avena sativa TaxID=4498 RepID=A0ACD5ZM35_AVESA